tara:strand:+ start:11 stop:208 length:198 start_codon:yes stop_codon:yes gene_type:complete
LVQVELFKLIVDQTLNLDQILLQQKLFQMVVVVLDQLVQEMPVVQAVVVAHNLIVVPKQVVEQLV